MNEVLHNNTTNNTAPTDPTKVHRRSSRNLHLIILLIVSLITIVGLIIAILVVKLSQPNNLAEAPTTNIDIGCSQYTNSDEIQDCIQNEFNENGDLDMLLSNYQEAIDNSLLNQDYYTAAELVNYRSDFLVSLNYCDQALQLLNNVDYSKFDQDSTLYIYASAMGTSSSCNDNVAQQEWNNRYITLTNSEDTNE